MAMRKGTQFDSLLVKSTDKRTALYKLQNGIKNTRKKSDIPPTIAQLAQQMQFRMANELACRLQELVKLGYKDRKGLMSPMNMMAKHIQKDALSGAYPDYRINYAKLCISNGIKGLHGLPWTDATLLPESKLELRWELFDDYPNYPVQDDAMHVLVYSEWLDDFAIFKNAGRAGDLILQLPLPAKFADEVIHCWVFITRNGGKMASKSEYLGEIM